jgi:hypothetical protein
MKRVTSKPRRPRARPSIAALAVALVIAALGATAGPAAASTHDLHPWQWPGQGNPAHGQQQPNVTVPGIDTTIQPQDLAPPAISVLEDSGDTAPGDVFAAPKIVTAGTQGQQGPEIVDNEGQPFYFLPIDLPYQASDFRVQQYRGQPVLTFDVGQSSGGPGHSSGEDVILNQHYQQIATVSAGNGLTADQHEFRLTDNGTALITSYHAVPYDLSKYGGPANGQVYDGVAQEIDVATGKVVWQWDSLDHVPLSDSYIPVPTNPSTPWDYFHINAVNPDTDGNILISGRGVSTIFKVQHNAAGNVIWRLGGKESTFQLGAGVQFNGQHNALPETGQPNTYRIFDNGNGGGPATGKPSRVIDVKIDPKADTATLVDSVQHPDGLIANSQGNSQRLANGDLFVGWGSVGRLSEFDGSGNLVWDGQVPAGYDSYRGYRSPWVGKPLTDPTAEATRIDPTHVDLSAIWNGATEVDRWLVLSGQNHGHLHPVGLLDWDGLDTEATVRTSDPDVELLALDSNGDPIGRSDLTAVSG